MESATSILLFAAFILYLLYPLFLIIRNPWKSIESGDSEEGCWPPMHSPPLKVSGIKRDKIEEIKRVQKSVDNSCYYCSADRK